jgi:hypothetical protein
VRVFVITIPQPAQSPDRLLDQLMGVPGLCFLDWGIRRLRNVDQDWIEKRVHFGFAA